MRFLPHRGRCALDACLLAGLSCDQTVPIDWKPIPVLREGRTSVLMYGPGAVLDRLFETDSVQGAPIAINVPVGLRTAVPRVGDSTGTADADDVLFVVPGPGNSDLGLT